jgi:hypothetical protein
MPNVAQAEKVLVMMLTNYKDEVAITRQARVNSS